MNAPAIWFPAVRTGTGTDVFTERLAKGLRNRGLRTEVTWLPLRSEYLPWTVPVPRPPEWANVVHVNTWLHPRFLPNDLPIVATVHHAVHAPCARAYKTVLRAAYHRYWIAPNERRLLRKADKAVAVSRFAAETARRWLLDREYDVVYNGVDTSTFRPDNNERRPEGPFRLLYVGGWTTNKGVELLAPIVRELGEGYVLRFTSAPASQKSTLPPNMQDIGRLHGDDAVAAAMQEADALLFPSRNEGFGLVVAEAMACGLPVVATRGSSLPEVIENGVTGILCAQNDTSAFVLAIRALAGDPTRTRMMGDAARTRAVTFFNIQQMVDGYIGLYRACLPWAEPPRAIASDSAMGTPG